MDLVHPGSLEFINDHFEQWSAEHGQQGLRVCIGEGPHSRAEPGGENNARCFFWIDIVHGSANLLTYEQYYFSGDIE